MINCWSKMSLLFAAISKSRFPTTCTYRRIPGLVRGVGNCHWEPSGIDYFARQLSTHWRSSCAHISWLPRLLVIGYNSNHLNVVECSLTIRWMHWYNLNHLNVVECAFTIRWMHWYNLNHLNVVECSFTTRWMHWYNSNHLNVVECSFTIRWMHWYNASHLNESHDVTEPVVVASVSFRLGSFWCVFVPYTESMHESKHIQHNNLA